MTPQDFIAKWDVGVPVAALNERPAWLTLAHHQLDAAVASAYGWADYTPELPDADILQRLLALNLAR